MTVKYGLLTASDEMASEDETYDFLYGLVRLLKPKVILETGTYKGGATEIMAKAIHHNGVGEIFTCDIERTFVQKINMASSHIFGTTEIGESLCRRMRDVDLAFIDSSGDRVAEVAALQLAPGAVVVLHDSNRPQYQPIWTIRPWKSIWHIPTIQGLTVFQS